MHKSLSFLFVLLLVNGLAYSQSSTKRVLQASRVTKSPKIDGVLDDEAWMNKPYASDFIQKEPQQNVPADKRTEVRIVYDDEAVYIAAMLYDSAPDSILKELSVRDNVGNADWFSLSFDTYFDLQNEVEFGVTASGIQFDNKTNANNFDMIWDSEVKINKEGWVVEMKIPYSALRFPEKDIQKWGLQLRRSVRRTREFSVWQFIAPDIVNYVSYFGILEGISAIKDPIRLSFTPYLGTTLSHYPYNIPGKSNFSSSYNAGLDLKYGINESFTLDMTLAPDFGQVQSDNQVLNLSAFETEFEENRPFFREGTELFNVGRLFYARRIGGTPKGFYDIESYREDSNYSIQNNPQQIQLINATKLTGRSPSGLGIGILNAITAESRASIHNNTTGQDSSVITEPFTNYNVIAVNRTLENNSYVSILNTNVKRAGVRNDANVSAIDFAVGDKKDRFKVRGFAAFSQKIFSDSVSDGFTYNLGISKVKGKLQYGLDRTVENDTYNPNDLGLLFSPDEISTSAWMDYNEYKPGRVLLNYGFNINLYYSTTYKTRKFQDAQMNFNYWHTYKKSYTTQWFYATNVPFGKHDYYEARTPGRLYKSPSFYGASTGISSDYRKPVALDINGGYFHDYTVGGRFWEMFIGPIFRISDRLKLTYGFSFSEDHGQGFASNDGTSIYFGLRDVRTHVNNVNATYIFTKNSSLTFRVRHYWSTVDVYQYKTLEMDGSLLVDTSGYNENNNYNVNFFNVDLIYQWRFAPGSDLIFVWKNNINTFSDNIHVDKKTGDRMLDSFYNTIKSNQTNTFTLKVLYYLDYRYLQRKQKA